MTVRIRIRWTPWWRKASRNSDASRVIKVRRPRPERVQPFPARPQALRVATPLTMWALSVLLTVGFLSVSMFATLTPAPSTTSKHVPVVAIDEDDPTNPVVGTVAADCRVMINMDGRLRCLEAVEYGEDNSGIVKATLSASSTYR